MKNGLVIADSGPIFSLATINKLYLLDSLFDEVKIPQAVWKEITLKKSVYYYDKIISYFESKIVKIKTPNDLSFIMDYGESESVILFREQNADFLLVDDKKARRIAENLNINCIGTLGLLVAAKEKSLVKNLKPLFAELIKNKRYYSLNLLNKILIQNDENVIDLK
jgi:predicted nucleic acid-binding protein